MNVCVLEEQVPAPLLEALRLTIQATEMSRKKKILFVTERAIEKLQENGYREPEYSETEFDGVSLATFKRVPSAAARAALIAGTPVPAEAVAAAAPAAPAAPAEAPKPKVKKVDPLEIPPPEEGKYAGECSIDNWEGSSFIVIGDGKAATPQNYKNWFKAKFAIPLSRVLNEKVTVCVPHNQPSAPVGEGFKVHIWASSLDGDEGLVALTKLFDISLPCTDRISGTKCSSDEYLELADRGTVFGAMNEHNLYLYWDAIHTGVEAEARVLLKVLEVVQASIGKKPQPGSPEEEKLAEDRYVQLTRKRFETLETQLKGAIATRETEIGVLGRNITEKIRQNQLDSINLAGFLAKGFNLDVLREEYQALRKLPHVVKVKVEATAISVFTDVLYCQNPDRKDDIHLMGRYRIVLKQDGSVWWHNLTHKIDGMNARMNAPHVYEDGHACLGSMSNVFPTLIGNGEYSAAAQMAIAFIESVNMQDAAGRNLPKWPLKSEADKREAEKAAKEAAKEAAKSAARAEKAATAG